MAQKVKTKKWLIGGSALIVVLGGAWYYEHAGNGAPRGPRVAAAVVRVAAVTQRDMPVVEHTIGTVIPNSTVQVTSQVQGRIDSAHFTEGQIVKKGDLLFQIDPRPFQAALDQAKGQLAKDQAALTGARNDLARDRALLAKNAVAQLTVDDQASLVGTDEGVVQADQANVDSAQINLDYTQIRSPLDGKTGPILVQPGNMVMVGGNATPLVTINQISPIKISFFLPQSELPRIQARQKAGGLSATIDFHDLGGKNLTAPVYFIGNAVSNQTGTIELRSTYNNAEAALVPGQLVNVEVELSDLPQATIIPHLALNASQDGQYVYVINGRKAELRPVKVLFDDTQNVAVSGDLKAGDQVVVEGQLQVTPGGTVDVVGGAPTGTLAGATGNDPS